LSVIVDLQRTDIDRQRRSCSDGSRGRLRLHSK